MTRAELEALARRVETEEPSRDLHAEIANAFRVFSVKDHIYGPPRFMECLDAAVTLVPEGWRVLEVRQRLDGYWVCVLQNQHRTKIETGMAPTEPRARTAAALRARAQEASDE